jgi:predicted outer membrane repeat protein
MNKPPTNVLGDSELPDTGDTSPDSDSLQESNSHSASPDHMIYLKSRKFIPQMPEYDSLANLGSTGKSHGHILVQLDFIPREAAKAELESLGLMLLAYVPDYTWIASVPTTDAAAVLNLPGVAWAGEFRVEDKIDPAIKADTWGPHNLASDGKTAAVNVLLHLDENLEAGQALIARYGGTTTGVTHGINLISVEMPKDNLLSLAAEDAIQWIEPAAPPLSGANDGIRAQIGVNVVNNAPYNLDGSGVDVLVYDSGKVGAHTDFGARLTIGAGETEIVREHSTHVAGTVGGSGANSTNQGGAALQWRGMAPAVDLISYAIGLTGSGVAFYENIPDIEADWAAAQNTYGADLGTASLSSNIYYNYYPESCPLMGNYGASSVLLDQIVRGGNSTIGIGDKYITTWAAGNERGWGTSCDTYRTTSPPSGAKNPIQVGGSNTNNNTQYAHTSWGPTDDGRIKPIVTAGACQTTGDGGITSTDNNPANDYTVMCGTSMATPAVAGGIALMLEHYRDVYSTSGMFWPSTAKALLMHTADDLGPTGPDYQWGYGQVDIQAAVDLITAQAFTQASISQGDVDVYYLVVPSSTTPLTVSLAWDDYQATLNADPTLINNLDLELVNPGGTAISRPWILNPDVPTDPATTGVDNLNNQEQVQVSNPAVGTWLVRVKGTAVPQGPQDYSLVCEGCQSIDMGVCHSLISGESSQQTSYLEILETGEAAVEGLNTEPAISQPLLTAGERWQRDLEARESATENQEKIDPAALLAAQNSGPLALSAYLEGLSSPLQIPGLDVTVQNQGMDNDSTENLAAVSRVGINGACTFTTIQSAVNAASNGDTLRVAAGVYLENVDITDKSITVEGDFNSTCTAKGGGETRIEGSIGPGSTLDITNGDVVLRDLVLSWGIDLAGGGVDARSADVTLDNVEVTKNYALLGGGVFVDAASNLTLINGSVISENAIPDLGSGGGLHVLGEASGSGSNILGNCAPNGGGVYQQGGSVQFESVAVVGNQALGEGGKGGGYYAAEGGTIETNNTTLLGGNSATSGGGIYLESGSLLSATETIIGFPLLFLWPNLADVGAGIYADSSTVDFSGTIDLNIADSQGAGLYATNSTVTLRDALVGGNSESYQGNILGPAGHTGVGIYLDNATQALLDNTRVVSNTFQTAGYTYGGGIYLMNSSHLTLSNNSSVEDHSAPHMTDGRGAGIYINASTVTVDNSQIISNTAGFNGGGIRMFDASTLNIQNGAILSSNRSLNGEGGAIAAVGTPDININNGTFHHNRANTDGGVVYVNAGTLDFNGWWDLRWNQADGNGGAVAVVGSADADFYATSGISYLAVNYAAGNGGALFLNNADTVALHATSGYQLRLNTNNASGNGGAGFADSGGFFDVYGDIQATSNIAAGDGGVFYLSGGSKVWLDDYGSTIPTLLVNRANNGGAIYAVDSPRVDCDGAELGGSKNGNQAVSGDGGAIYLNNSSLTADNCTFQNNQAAGNGGAIAGHSDSTLTIGADYPTPAVKSAEEERFRDELEPGAPTATACDPALEECSTFKNNTADSDLNNRGSGGAIFTSASSLQLSHTHLHHNSAYLGGAIYQAGLNSVGQVRDSLIHNNAVSGVAGAGIRIYEGDFSLSQVTLADNIGASGFSGDINATNQVENSIAWGNSGGGFSGTFSSSDCTIDQSGVVGSNVDPGFVDPASGNYQLSYGSPAIDACTSGLTPDLNNRSRPFGSSYDMGAYEFSTDYAFLPIILR